MDQMDRTDLEIVERRFKRVFCEIDQLESKIYKQKGWFFKEHVHTINELLDSEHHRKIFSWTEKIGDDFDRWYKKGKFSEKAKNRYYQKREDIEDELQKVNHKIENREPTWWEDFKGAFNDFIVKVVENMPDLFRNLLEKAASSLRLSFFINRTYALTDDKFDVPF